MTVHITMILREEEDNLPWFMVGILFTGPIAPVGLVSHLRGHGAFAGAVS